MNPAQQVLQVATGYMASSCLYAAITLNIADHLSAGPKTMAELAKASGANEDALYRTLRLLSSLGIFEEVGPKTFALTPAADLLRTDAPGSLRGMAVFLPDPLHYRIYGNIMHSVSTGRPAADFTLGMPVFQYLEKDQAYSQVFNDAMTALSAPVAGAAIDVYDFSGIGTLVDVAGGHGEVLMSILKAHPKVRGVLADLGHVVEGAKPRIASAGLADRMEAVACDFFQAVPAGGDAYIMKHIIHDWDDERASVILKNIATAMGAKKGRVILLESVIAAGDTADLGKFIDIEMLLFPGGRERTADEFRSLFARSGFHMTKVVATKSPLSVIEAVRT
ncbi:MAG TPA: methyltransferase [Vicinamibacterales bacterium]|nr:methyltransferase [Vicinamibacterales bacterium]